MCLFLFLCAQPDSQPSLQGPCLQLPAPPTLPRLQGPGQSSAAISLSTHFGLPNFKFSG